MLCRPPRKIKRYVTDPDEFVPDQRSKYNNLTLQEIKLQLTPLEALNQINVPSVLTHQINPKKQSNHFMPLQPKFHLRRNPLRRLNDPNVQTQSSNNGYDISKTNNPQKIFKRSNPLFLVNTLIDILKQDTIQTNSVTHPKKILRDKKQFENNQFTDFQGKSLKVQRAPRLVEGQLSRLTQQSNFSRRKIYSQQKSRQKTQGDMQLLTFYKPKIVEKAINNEFLL